MSIALNRLGALDAARKQRRELTAVQLVRACFARIEQRENTIHAWTALQKQAALGMPSSSTGPAARSAAWPAHRRERPVRHRRPAHALRLAHLRTPSSRPGCRRGGVVPSAGAVVVGKTVTTEFATYTAGPRATRATRPIRPAVRPAARPRRWPTTWCLSRWARRPPAPSSVRPRTAASSASSPLSARFRAPASKAWRNRWTPWAASPVRCRTSPCSRRC